MTGLILPATAGGLESSGPGSGIACSACVGRPPHLESRRVERYAYSDYGAAIHSGTIRHVRRLSAEPREIGYSNHGTAHACAE